MILLRHGQASKGALHLTTHHMIFRDDATGREMWICYPIIADVELRLSSHLLTQSSSLVRIRCRDFIYIAFGVNDEQTCQDIFDSIMKLTCVPSIEKLYAFLYKPGSLERQINSWNIYSPIKEFERQGVDSRWRYTKLNKDYSWSPTYPATLMIPETISDNVLNYAVKFRSKGRLPVLTYFHKFNSCTITRCSQPMVGLKQSRSIQDEKLINSIFATTQPVHADGDLGTIIGSHQSNLLVDARPTTNAMAQTALGAGTENMDYYKGASKVYLGIENIHVMRDSLAKVVESLRNSDLSPMAPNQDLLHRSQWLKHLSVVLDGAVLIAKHVHYQFSHVVIHCSDGWDRTSQLSSLAQLFLDPYYRTIEGFMVLIEKDWLSFGHRFAERSGFLSSEKHFVQFNDVNQAQHVFNTVSNKLVKQSHVKYTSPVFHQFVDCVYQIMRQAPALFEFNERFLRRLFYHTYSCQYGTFLYNNEKDRVDNKIHTKTRSVWDYFLVRKKEFSNDKYDPNCISESEIFLPDPKDVQWWPELYGRSNDEMNGVPRATTMRSDSTNSSLYQKSQTGSPAQKSDHSRKPTPSLLELDSVVSDSKVVPQKVTKTDQVEVTTVLSDENTVTTEINTALGTASSENSVTPEEMEKAALQNFENDSYDPLGAGTSNVTRRFDSMALDDTAVNEHRAFGRMGSRRKAKG